MERLALSQSHDAERLHALRQAAVATRLYAVFKGSLRLRTKLRELQRTRATEEAGKMLLKESSAIAYDFGGKTFGRVWSPAVS